MNVFFLHTVYSLLLSGPEDIHDGNVKLLLGLLWLCIQKYQLGAGFAGGALNEASKRYLLAWIQAAVDPGVTNFTSSWQDGRYLRWNTDTCFSNSRNANNIEYY